MLGADGFGRSDTRAALTALVEQGSLDRQVCQQAIERYGLQAERAASWV